MIQQNRFGIVAIKRTKLPKGFWKYDATLSNGTTQVVRAKATQEYYQAHLHDRVVCTGKRDLGAFVTFGQRPKRPKDLLQTFDIEDMENAK